MSEDAHIEDATSDPKAPGDPGGESVSGAAPCTQPNCPDCGNDFIESFGNRRTWWMGCKRCSNHVKARDRERASEKWKAYAATDNHNA